MGQKIITFFDKLEDHVRGHLSKHPIIYALIGGIGVVLFWRGVWHVADDIGLGSISSLGIGTVILMLTGVLVSSFIGGTLIISGLRGEKKLAEKTKEELDNEGMRLQNIEKTLHKIEHGIDSLEDKIEK